MPTSLKGVLENATVYHYARHVVTGGLPFSRWTELYGLADGSERVADLGCGPADILRYLSRARRPAFYLGIDISQAYLKAAKQRASSCGVDSAWIAMDLTRLPSDREVQNRLVGILEEHQISRVLLLGVIHHIDDKSALEALNLVEGIRTVRTMVTQDVIRVPGLLINNYYCDMDRGEHIRDENGYDSLMSRSNWPKRRKFWTSPRLPLLRYIHYEMSK